MPWEAIRLAPAVRMTAFFLNVPIASLLDYAPGSEWRQHSHLVNSESCCTEYAKTSVYTHTTLSASFSAALA